MSSKNIPEEVRKLIIHSLSTIADEPSISAIAAAVQHDPSADVRAAAIEELQWLGSAETLITALHDKSAAVRRAAARALACRRFSSDTSAAVTALVATLRRDKNVSVREEALRAIAQQDTSVAVDVLNVLIEVLINDISPTVRAAAALSLSRISGDSSAVVDALLAALGDKSQKVRAAAAIGLGRLDENVIERNVIINALTRAFANDSVTVKNAVVVALQALGASEVLVALAGG